MVCLFDGFNYIVRLDRGERLREGLASFFESYTIDGASITAIGGVVEVELGFYNLEKKKYQWKTIQRTLEITSLTGTIALDEADKPIYHLHATFGDEDYQVVGGHVKDFVVGGTCELFIHRTYQPLRRKHDPEVGLNILDL